MYLDIISNHLPKPKCIKIIEGWKYSFDDFTVSLGVIKVESSFSDILILIESKIILPIKILEMINFPNDFILFKEKSIEDLLLDSFL